MGESPFLGNITTGILWCLGGGARWWGQASKSGIQILDGVNRVVWSGVHTTGDFDIYTLKEIQMETPIAPKSCKRDQNECAPSTSKQTSEKEHSLSRHCFGILLPEGGLFIFMRVAS